MIKRVLWVFSFCILLSSTGYAKETLIIAGAGPSTNIVTLFFQNFSKQPSAQNYEFIVPQESVKHAGGIRHSFKNLFGRTGRPLNAIELKYRRVEIFLAIMPISIVTGHGVNISKMSMRQLQEVFQGQTTNWKKLGGPDEEIVTVGRESTEALFTELKRYYTFFRKPDFDLILNKDHEVYEFLNSPEGSFAISFGAKSNLSDLNLITIKEKLSVGVRVGLVYDVKNEEHPLVLAVKEYAQSDEWKTIVTSSGAFPVN